MNNRKWMVGAGVLLCVLGLAWVLLGSLTNHATEDIFTKEKKTIIYEGTFLNHSVMEDGGHLYVSLDFLQAYMDEGVYIDEATSSVILTTKQYVLQLKDAQTQVFVNESAYEMQAPAKLDGDTWWIPAEVVDRFYPFVLTYTKETELATLTKKATPIHKAQINKSEKAVPVRKEGSRKSPIVSEAVTGEFVTILKKNKKWTFIQQQNGYVGYIESDKFSAMWEEQIPFDKAEENVTASLQGKKINMTWEAVYTQTPNTETFGEMPGVNVVSPTWFELENGQGDITSKADGHYVQWAHDTNRQVWALFSNGFEPEKTHEMLRDYDKRMHVIRQILTYANLYELDGINIDFENVYLKDKEELVQFVRELTPYLHAEGLVVSMDITTHSTSEVWSMFYDRKKLAEVVDYMALMSYDEHPVGSAIAGSVASLPWVENGLKGVLEEVPNEKLLLGIPFYTRVWTEGKDGIQAKTLSMENTKDFLIEHALTPAYDEKTEQYYVRYFDKKEKLYRSVWLEDETSLVKRLGLVQKYELAGIASWQRGFADDSVWTKIEKTLQKKD